MSLSYVTLTGTLPGATENTLIQLSPSNWLTDAQDDLLIPPQSVSQYCTPGTVDGQPCGRFTIPDLLATDNENPTPSGWYWTVTISGVPGATYETWSFFLAYADGAVQDISTLVAIQPPDEMAEYLPVPSGTPNSGDVPVATGDGQASAWQAFPGGDKNFVQEFSDTDQVTVQHNLGKYPAVAVFDSSGGLVIGDITYQGINALTVSFSAPFSGTVTCN